MKVLSQSFTKKIICITTSILLIYLILTSIGIFYLLEQVRQALSPVPSFLEILQNSTSDALKQNSFNSINALLLPALKLFIGFVLVAFGLLGFIKNKKFGIILLLIYAAYFMLSIRFVGIIEIILGFNSTLMIVSMIYWLANFRSQNV